MKGRLNLFQAAMLRWRDAYPYNAVHVAELARPARRRAPARADGRASHRAWRHRLVARCRQAALRVRGRTGACRDRRARGQRRRASGPRAGNGAAAQRAVRRRRRVRPVALFRARQRRLVPSRRGLRPLHRRRRFDRRAAEGDRRALRGQPAGEAHAARPVSADATAASSRATRWPSTSASTSCRAMLLRSRRAFRPRYPHGDGSTTPFTSLELPPDARTRRVRAPRRPGASRSTICCSRCSWLRWRRKCRSALTARRRKEIAIASVINIRDELAPGPEAGVRAVPELVPGLASGARRHHAGSAGARRPCADTQRVKRRKLYLQTLYLIACGGLAWRVHDARAAQADVREEVPGVGRHDDAQRRRDLGRSDRGRASVPHYLRAVPDRAVRAARDDAGVGRRLPAYRLVVPPSAFRPEDIDRIDSALIACARRLAMKHHSPVPAQALRSRLRCVAARLRRAAAARRRRTCAPPSPPHARPIARLEDRILALDPERVTAADVRQMLAQGPTPRIMLLHGGIYPVHLSMASFGRFLVGMGYPEARIRDPCDGKLVAQPVRGRRAARRHRRVALREGRHAADADRPQPGRDAGGQGPARAERRLQRRGRRVESAHRFCRRTARRSSIRSPATSGPSSALTLSYASAVGAGGAAFLLPNQWSMLGKLRTIPDTVDEFTGYSIDARPGRGPCPASTRTRKFENGGRAKVRNVTLPAGINHITVPVTAQLAARIRRCAKWIDAYVPGTPPPPPPTARKRAVGRRRLVQRQETLGAGGAAPDPRHARRRRPAVTGKLE